MELSLSRFTAAVGFAVVYSSCHLQQLKGVALVSIVFVRIEVPMDLEINIFSNNCSRYMHDGVPFKKKVFGTEQIWMG